jgi:predicted nucleic acid-binding protein
VLIDSSFLYSALIFGGKPLKLLDMIIEGHTPVISDYIIKEIIRNIQTKMGVIDSYQFLREFEVFIKGCEVKRGGDYCHLIPPACKVISLKDAPVLACGMLSDIDILLTSDKEFWAISDDRVRICSTEDLLKILDAEVSTETF